MEGKNHQLKNRNLENPQKEMETQIYQASQIGGTRIQSNQIFARTDSKGQNMNWGTRESPPDRI